MNIPEEKMWQTVFIYFHTDHLNCVEVPFFDEGWDSTVRHSNFQNELWKPHHWSQLGQLVESNQEQMVKNYSKNLGQRNLVLQKWNLAKETRLNY